MSSTCGQASRTAASASAAITPDAGQAGVVIVTSISMRSDRQSIRYTSPRSTMFSPTSGSYTLPRAANTCAASALAACVDAVSDGVGDEGDGFMVEGRALVKMY